MSRKMIDLFAGLGGASEAFVRADWDVMRLDNNAELEDVEYMHIVDLNIKSPKKFDEDIDIELIWASPPCIEFSNAYLAPKSVAKRNGLEFVPSFDLVKAAKTIIENLKPKYWVIENVKGSIKDLTPILGEPRQIIGPYVLWGNFPFIDVRVPKDYKKPDAWSTTPLRANIRAKVPYWLSDGLKNAIDDQSCLFDFQEEEE